MSFRRVLFRSVGWLVVYLLRESSPCAPFWCSEKTCATGTRPASRLPALQCQAPLSFPTGAACRFRLGAFPTFVLPLTGLQALVAETAYARKPHPKMPPVAGHCEVTRGPR